MGSFFRLSLIILMLYFGGKECRADDPCDISIALDISDGEVLEDGSISYDGIVFPPSLFFEHDSNETMKRYGCVCTIKTCARKCCGESEVYYGKECLPAPDGYSQFSPPVYSATNLIDDNQRGIYAHKFQRECAQRYFAEHVYLQQDGTLLEVQVSISNELHHDLDIFCLETFMTDPLNPDDTAWTPKLGAIVCLPDNPVEIPILNLINAIGMVLSLPFLLLTLLVYILLPELRNLHGKCLMAYISGLIVAFAFLAYVQLQSQSINISLDYCVAIAFIIYFSFLTSMFWMNAMCFDIWRTFSGFGGRGKNENRDFRRFIYYGIYSWGVPALLVGLLLIIEKHEGIPDTFVKPRFGLMKCWFYSWQGEIVYLYAPMLILVTINLILFGVTSHKINTIQRETSILKGADSARNDHINKDKRRFIIYIRLMVVMGVTWALEVLSVAFGGTGWYWTITDLANLFLGVYIFFVFVYKKKVWNLLTKRYKFLRRFRRKDDPAAAENNAWTTRQSGQTDDTRLTSDSVEPTVMLQLRDIPVE